MALEDLIRQRIMDRNFDDPPRVAAAVVETKKTEFELNDQKSKKVVLPDGGTVLPCYQ